VHEGSERSFLFGTAIRVASDHRKQSARRRETHDDAALDAEATSTPTAEELLDQRRARALLDGVLDHMPDDLRSVFVLAELEGMTMSEMADLLAIPTGTVASRLRRARALFEEHLKRKYEHLLGRARAAHGRGWQPDVELCGAEHLEHALAAGRGAVLWVTAFCGPLVPKIALARGGFRVAHLSMPFHGGFSRSRAAVHVLNPWTRRAEDKHLAERVVIPLDGTLGYMRRLREILVANGCVSIAGEHCGRQNVTVPFLDGKEAFATGAWSLARSTGAALLTVRAHRPAPGVYRVVIDPPVAIDPGLARTDGARVVIGELAARLEGSVRAYPADWERWSTIDPAAEPR
jgi:RNA polymerase sigma-70 factor (ECF subfamily)